MRFPNLILTTVLLFSLHWALGPDPDSGFRPAARFGIQVLWSGTLNFNTRSSYLYYIEHRLKTDLSDLFQIAQEIVKETRFDSRSADYRQVSHTANRIRKLANRIKSGLTLGNLPEEEKTPKEAAPQMSSPELLRSQVDELSRLVYKIRQSATGRTKHVIDARLQQEFYAQVDTLETLAIQLKVSADELMLNK